MKKTPKVSLGKSPSSGPSSELLKLQITKSRKSRYQQSTTIHTNTDYDKLFNRLFPKSGPRAATQYQKSKMQGSSKTPGLKTGRNSRHSTSSPNKGQTPKNYSVWKPDETVNSPQNKNSANYNSKISSVRTPKNGRKSPSGKTPKSRHEKLYSKSRNKGSGQSHLNSEHHAFSSSNIHSQMRDSKHNKSSVKKLTQYSAYDFDDDAGMTSNEYSQHHQQPEQLRLKNLSELCILKLKELDRRSREGSKQDQDNLPSSRNRKDRYNLAHSGKTSPKGNNPKSRSKSKSNKIFLSSINNKVSSELYAQQADRGSGAADFIGDKNIEKLRSSYTKIFKNAMTDSLKNVVTQPMKKKVKDSEYFKFS